MEKCKIESGLQLISRIQQKQSLSTLEGVYPEVLPDNGPKANQFIEVIGKARNAFLLELLTRLVLPKHPLEDTWKETNILLIVLEFQMNILDIAKLLDKALRKYWTSAEERHLQLKLSLNRLTLLHCFNDTDVELTLLNMDHMIEMHPVITAVIIDNITENYWLNRVSEPSSTMTQYCDKQMEVLKDVVRHLNLVVFTGRSGVITRFPLKNIDYTVVMEDEDMPAKIENYTKCTNA